MKSLDPAFKYLAKVADLPLILAGPILRRTEADKVTVWLALKEKRSLRLEIYETANNGSEIGDLLLVGQDETIAIGKHLHLLAISARPLGEKKLKSDRIYAYNIYFSKDNSDSPGDRYSLLDDTKVGGYSLSYFAHQLPTFSLPPEDLDSLKILHGSCRKPHGGGRDTLSFVDSSILQSAHLATERPHQLFLTGDQIYGDDVADPILWLAQGVSKLLLGWSEELPLMSGTIEPEELYPGKRAKIAELEGGLTAMLKNSPQKAKSHLMSFGEYAATYLLSWSPVLIPPLLSKAEKSRADTRQTDHWQKELKDIRSFIGDLRYVRRGLANIPVYTICDDHDVSDDWYLNREWCDRVLGKPLGKRIIQNGILAYGLFQAWGNTPEYFENNRVGTKLLDAASRWCASGGRDESAKQECDLYLGIPTNDKVTGLPKMELDRDVLVLSRSNLAIPWHYHLTCNNHEVILLDTRTWRGYPPEKDRGLAPPMLLSHQAFKQQLNTPLSQTNSDIEATIIVLPTNLVALEIIDRIQQLELLRDRVFNSDVGDSWNFHETAFASLLLTICQQRKRVIILSGDIHYSCAVRLSHWFHDSSEGSVLVQLTSSAIKNSEPATRVVHTKLKSLLPEKTKRWLAWDNPFKLIEIGKKTQKKYLRGNIPDWQYRVEWCERKPAKNVSWQKPPSELHACQDRPMTLWRKAIAFLTDRLWCNRWLQDGTEVIGRNNLSLVRFDRSMVETVIQETYWYAPWGDRPIVKSCYRVSLEADPLPRLKS